MLLYINYYVHFSRNEVYSFHQHLKCIHDPQERLESAVSQRQVIYVKTSMFLSINPIYVLQEQVLFTALLYYDF